MMWWAMWCAAVLARSAVSAPASDAMPALDLAQLDPPGSDDDGVSFGVPPMGTRYDNSAAPWLYLLAEMPHETQPSGRLARRRRTFSVNPAVETLQRNAFNNHLERVAHRNRNFLNCVGKRDPWSTSNCLRTGAGERRPRLKRKMPSLSINNPMEVLRQRLLQEVVRKQMREANQRQAFANRLFLQNVGKRGFLTNSGSNRYDE